jgi:ribosome-associated protein
MDIKALQLAIVDGLEDVKGQDIKVFDTTHLTSLFDRVIIASGTSNRQTRSLASSVADKVRENGGKILSIEGGETGEWVLVDCGDAIVHILQPALRQYYNLEELWGGKAVRVTTPAAKKASGRRKASEDDADDDKPGVVSPSRMAKPALAPIAPAGLAAQTTEDEPLPGSKTAARKTAAKKTAAKKAPTTARKTVARKSTGTASTGAKPASKAAPAAKRAPAAVKRAPAPAAKKAVARKRAAPKAGA